MLKRLCAVAFLAAPAVALTVASSDAADLRMHHRHAAYHHHYVRHYPRRLYANDHPITCTTSSFLLFSTSTCSGGGFDPLGVSGL